MVSDWQDLVTKLSANIRPLRVETPDIMRSFTAMGASAGATGVLDAKTKELIALAIGVLICCDDCIAFHSKGAVQHGATREEVLETLSIAIYMGAGPSVTYASHALAAFTQFSEEKYV